MTDTMKGLQLSIETVFDAADGGKLFQVRCIADHSAFTICPPRKDRLEAVSLRRAFEDALRSVIAAEVEASRLPQAGAGDAAVQQPVGQHVEGFLCRAWGETDLPEARLVESADEWKAFVVEAQWGPGLPYRVLDDGDREAVDAQVKYIIADMADNGTGAIEFEIGGVSVERVTFLAAAPLDRIALSEERERCARICETFAQMVDDGAGAVGRLWQVARNIRSGDPVPGWYDPTRKEPMDPAMKQALDKLEALNASLSLRKGM